MLVAGRYACSRTVCLWPDGMLVAGRYARNTARLRMRQPRGPGKKYLPGHDLTKTAQNEEIRLRDLSHDLGRKTLLL